MALASQLGHAPALPPWVVRGRWPGSRARPGLAPHSTDRAALCRFPPPWPAHPAQHLDHRGSHSVRQRRAVLRALGRRAVRGAQPGAARTRARGRSRPRRSGSDGERGLSSPEVALRAARAIGVATRGPVLSVLLFSRRPANALGGALISVTPETSTSIRLLRLLLDVRRGLEGVRYMRGLEPAQADAMLMIGDSAMRMRDRRPPGFTHTLDLGADWLEWTGLSFVYAVWAVRTALSSRGQAGADGVSRRLTRGRTVVVAGSGAAADRAGLERGGDGSLPAPIPLSTGPRRSRRSRAVRAALGRTRTDRAGVAVARVRTGAPAHVTFPRRSS